MKLWLFVNLLGWSGALTGPSISSASHFNLHNPALDSSWLRNTGSEKAHFKERSVNHRRSDVRKGRRAHPSTIHEVVFTVKENIDELDTLVHDISNPYSDNFGMHLTRDDVSVMTSNVASFRHIVSYLRLHDINIVKKSKHFDHITASASVEQWESLFFTEFYEFELENCSETVIRADHYSISDTLKDHVEAVFNTVQFPMNQRRRNMEQPYLKSDAQPATTSNPYYGYTHPDVIKSVYDIRNNTGNSLSSQAVFQYFPDQHPSDLTVFQDFFGLPKEEVTGASDGDPIDCDECSTDTLDLQYLMAVSQSTPTSLYFKAVDDDPLEWILDIAEMDNPAKVISINWQYPENYFTSSAKDFFNRQALKLVAMGVTLVAASGDSGAPDYVKDSSPLYCGYRTMFPAVSPYVTAVGATMGPESDGPEVACDSSKVVGITSGGGFSEHFPAPAWQSESISSYFSNAAADGTSPLQGYNAGGRGIPDVALMGRRFLGIKDDQFIVRSSSSVSAAVFAGMVSLINAKRLASGKSRLGWINPSLYALQDAFKNDITENSNHCTSYEFICCAHGFAATTGWDPVTGLGSVNYTSLEIAFLALGNSVNIPTELPSMRPGAPSVRPTRLPSVTPTRAPTLAPTAATGWMYINSYRELECSGAVVRVEGYKVGLCFATYYNSGQLTGLYWKYSCNSAHGYANVYSDSACLNFLTTMEISLSCSYQNHYQYNDYGNDYYNWNLIANEAFSQSLECSSSEFMPLDESLTFVVSSWNSQGTSCEASNIVRFEAFASDECFSTSYASMKYLFPYIRFYYQSRDCTGVTITNSLNTDCYSYYYYYSQNSGNDAYSNQGNDDFSYSGETTSTYSGSDSTGSYSSSAVSSSNTDSSSSSGSSNDPDSSSSSYIYQSYFYGHSSTFNSPYGAQFWSAVGPNAPASPTRSPTFTRLGAPSLLYPTAAPQSHESSTRIPTPVPTRLRRFELIVNQILNGISAAEFNSASVNSEVFLSAVVDCWAGVSQSSLVISNVSDVSRLLEDTSVLVIYSLIFTPAALGYDSDGSDAYEYLSSALVHAVSESDDFNSRLAFYAANLHADAMVSVTSNYVTYYIFEVYSDDDNDRHSRDLSGRDKLILAVAAGFGGLILLLCCFVAIVRNCNMHGSTLDNPVGVVKMQGDLVSTQLEMVHATEGEDQI